MSLYNSLKSSKKGTQGHLFSDFFSLSLIQIGNKFEIERQMKKKTNMNQTFCFTLVSRDSVFFWIFIWNIYQQRTGNSQNYVQSFIKKIFIICLQWFQFNIEMSIRDFFCRIRNKENMFHVPCNSRDKKWIFSVFF